MLPSMLTELDPIQIRMLLLWGVAVLALMLGHAFNGEALGLRLVAGAGLVLLGLGLHQRDAWWRRA